jgi:hypothetical protein
MHTRATKWGERLQRLFVLADVQTKIVSKVSRSSGKLKDEPEAVKVSTAHPHMLGHTLTRDLLENVTLMEEIAELLENSVAVVEKRYSEWDKRRQSKLESRLQSFWECDPLSEKLSQAKEPPTPPETSGEHKHES